MVTKSLLNDLDWLEDDPTIHQIVIITHMPILEEQIPRKPDDKTWGFANAFYGNLTLGREVLARQKVSHIVSGHTHMPMSAQVRSEDNRTISTHVIGSDYRKPAYLRIDSLGQPS